MNDHDHNAEIEQLRSWLAADKAEIETLRTQLAHWKVFAEHAEGERSRLQGEVMRLSHELARLRHD